MSIWAAAVYDAGMRLAMVVALTALLGCAHPAYGPSSDDRLESAVKEAQTGDTLSDDAVGKEIQKRTCTGQRKQLSDAIRDDKPDSERLTAVMKIYAELKQKGDELDKIIKANPGAEFATAGKTASQTLDECNSLLADARSGFDRLIREITELPVLKEFHGSSELAVARVDFKLLRQAIDALDPDDRDALTARVETAEQRVLTQKKKQQ